MMIKRFKRTAFYKKHRYRLERANGILSFVSALCLILFLMGDQSAVALKNHALASQIKSTAILTGIYSGVFSVDDDIIQAMARVPRHRYTANHYSDYAYYNVALPVDGQDYLMAEPFITAMMIELLDVERKDKVLEIGFGSGYDAAVLSRLVRKVYSVSQSEMMKTPAPNLHGTKTVYGNIKLRPSNDVLGWPEAGPYDAILVRQSMREVPAALIEQLKPGGRLVIPIGSPHDMQRLTVFKLTEDGRLVSRETLHVKISPLLKGREI